MHPRGSKTSEHFRASVTLHAPFNLPAKNQADNFWHWDLEFGWRHSEWQPELTESEFVLWGVVRGHPNAGSTGIVWGFFLSLSLPSSSSLSFSFCLHCLCHWGDNTFKCTKQDHSWWDLYLRDTIVSDCSGHRDGGTDPAVHLVVGHNWCWECKLVFTALTLFGHGFPLLCDPNLKIWFYVPNCCQGWFKIAVN